MQNHTRSAVAALHRIAIYKRLLQWMQAVAVGQTFDGSELLPRHGADRCKAGAMSHTVNENCAGAALAFTTTVFSAGKVEIIPEYPQKGALRICFDTSTGTVHDKVHELILDLRAVWWCNVQPEPL